MWDIKDYLQTIDLIDLIGLGLTYFPIRRFNEPGQGQI